MTTVERTRPIVGEAASVERRAGARRRAEDVPILEARPGGMAERVSEHLPTDLPVFAFLSTLILGYVVIASLLIAVGLALEELLSSLGGFAAWDEGINDWLAGHRTPTLEHLSWIGSTMAGGVVIPAVIGLLLVAFLALRRWRLAAFVLFVVAVESAAYRAATLVVHRERPSVHRLENLPVDASFPSGHTAASLALYGGLVLLLASRVRSVWTSWTAGIVLLIVPAFVAWSRMYRGMHHLTDSLAGILLGLGAISVTVFAVRVGGATDDRRRALSHGRCD